MNSKKATEHIPLEYEHFATFAHTFRPPETILNVVLLPIDVWQHIAKLEREYQRLNTFLALTGERDQRIRRRFKRHSSSTQVRKIMRTLRENGNRRLQAVERRMAFGMSLQIYQSHKEK